MVLSTEELIRNNYPTDRDRLVALYTEGMYVLDDPDHCIELDSKLRQAFVRIIDKLLADVERLGISYEIIDDIECSEEINELARKIDFVEAKLH